MTDTGPTRERELADQTLAYIEHARERYRLATDYNTERMRQRGSGRLAAGAEYNPAVVEQDRRRAEAERTTTTRTSTTKRK